MAAGLTVRPQNLDAVRQRLNALARRALKPRDLQPPLRLDAEVDLSEVNERMLAELDRLKPVGQGNPAVQLASRELVHRRPLQRMGAERQHVKMWITNGRSSL